MFDVEKFNRPNKYAGKCQVCERWVESGAGKLGRDEDSNKFVTVCLACATGEQVIVEQVEQTFPLTDEQKEIIALFNTGKSLAVQAGAGTGKSTTLIAIANSTSRVGQYIAFNKDIVVAATKKLPKNVRANTANSLAYQAIGKQYSHRLRNSKRMKSHEQAKWLGVKSFTWQFAGELHTLSPGALASYVLQTVNRFCQGADPVPIAVKHLPFINGLDQEESSDRRFRLCKQLQPAIDKAWTDLQDVNGVLPFSHAHYTKMWALGTPIIPGSFILFDEAQDADAVMIDVVLRQNKQVVWVGDSQQQIYDWRGAVNAMDNVGAENTAYLTHSFRFGPEIADVANLLLSTIDSAKLRLVGRGAASTVGAHSKPNAIICRTNAGAIGAVLGAMADGLSAVLVGKNDDIARFVKAVIGLQDGKRTEHPELACFADWEEVEYFVENDPSGEELQFWVNLFKKFSPQDVLSAVSSTVSLVDADVVVTTAHKSKGLEWDVVQLASDFPKPDPDKGKVLSDADKRLLYVAATRAMKHLDFENCAAVADLFYGN